MRCVTWRTYAPVPTPRTMWPSCPGGMARRRCHPPASAAITASSLRCSPRSPKNVPVPFTRACHDIAFPFKNHSTMFQVLSARYWEL